MKYYHRSLCKSLKFIHASSEKAVRTAIQPRIPECSEGEDQETLRVCIAPTVWQCLLTKSAIGEETLHIYEINVERATEPKGPPVDFAETDEKWLTDDDINECGGRIEMRNRGFIKYNGELEDKLRELKKQNKLPRSPAAEDSIWKNHNGEWSLALNSWL